MVLGYYNRVPSNPISVSGYGNTPSHTSDYGFYVSKPYWYGTNYFNTAAPTPSGGSAQGAYGYIWKDGVSSVAPNLLSYLGLHDFSANLVAQPSESAARALVESEIDSGRPLLARTYLTGAGHYVVVVGYEVVGDTFKYLVNDPFGEHPYAGGYDPTWGQSSPWEVPQPQAYTYAQMDLGNANGSRGLITVASTAWPDWPDCPFGGSDFENTVYVNQDGDAVLSGKTLGAGDHDGYRLYWDRSGTAVVETTGSTDTRLAYYDGPGSVDLEDDDSGSGLNAQINTGIYRWRDLGYCVAGYSASTTGTYGLSEPGGRLSLSAT
jgi:hypothetical protein